MSDCPCCSDRLLRQVKGGSLSWFCRTCWAEMPNFDEYLQPPTMRCVKPDFTDSTHQPILKVALQAYYSSDPEDVSAQLYEALRMGSRVVATSQRSR